jgi:hypothetical protein
VGGLKSITSTITSAVSPELKVAVTINELTPSISSVKLNDKTADFKSGAIVKINVEVISVPSLFLTFQFVGASIVPFLYGIMVASQSSQVNSSKSLTSS